MNKIIYLFLFIFLPYSFVYSKIQFTPEECNHEVFYAYKSGKFERIMQALAQCRKHLPKAYEFARQEKHNEQVAKQIMAAQCMQEIIANEQGWKDYLIKAFPLIALGYCIAYLEYRFKSISEN